MVVSVQFGASCAGAQILKLDASSGKSADPAESLVKGLMVWVVL
jgi:hypothetical protein